MNHRFSLFQRFRQLIVVICLVFSVVKQGEPAGIIKETHTRSSKPQIAVHVTSPSTTWQTLEENSHQATQTHTEFHFPEINAESYNETSGLWEKIFTGNVTSSKNWYGFIAESPATTLINIEYKFKFDHRFTSLSMVIYSGTTIGKLHENMTCADKLYSSEFSSKWMAFNNFVKLLSPFVSANCKSDGLIIECLGQSGFRLGVAKSFYLAIADCDTTGELNVQYEIIINNVEIQSDCEKLDVTECQRFYRTTKFPNMVGHNSQASTKELTNYFAFLIANLHCYEHLLMIGCHSLFPECRNGVSILPCRLMCEEMLNGCDKVFLRYGLSLSCSFFPQSLDPKICFYKPVDCGEPDEMEVGKGTVSILNGTTPGGVARYMCDRGYTLKGQRDRVCLHSGKWANKAAICEKTPLVENKNDNVLYSLAVLLPVILVIIVILIIIYARQTIRILQFRLWPLSKPKDKGVERFAYRYDAYISYSPEDLTYVTNQLIPHLENNHVPQFQLCVKDRNFLPGAYFSEKIYDAIQSSRKTIVLLSASYIRNEQCQFEFQLAFAQVVEQHTERLVLILMHDMNDTELQPDMRAFKNTHTYIRLGDFLYWDRIKYALAT